MGISDMAKKDVLMKVTKYGFEYVSSAKMYLSGQFWPILEKEDNSRWPRNSNLSIRRPSREVGIFLTSAGRHSASQHPPGSLEVSMLASKKTWTVYHDAPMIVGGETQSPLLLPVASAALVQS
jgi:hypothetical protein